MAKFVVTPELASTLKAIRVQNNVTAKSVAGYIGKSQSYMSKLEKGEIKNIDEDELTRLFKFIYKDNINGQESMETILENIYSTIEMRYTDEEINKQTWWDTYDTVRRNIPIPSILVDDIVNRMKSIGLSVDILCDRINANEGISPQVSNIDQFPFNEWKAFVTNHKVDFYFIKMKVEKDVIGKILSKEIDGTNYVTMLAIAYYLHKIEKFKEQVIISEEDNNNLNILARDYLNSFQFYSISEKYKLSRLAKSDEEREGLLSTFDRENFELVNNILVKFKIFSDLDIRRSNKCFTIFCDNLDWDLPFIMAVLNIRFSELEDVSYSNKKKMLNEIRDIVNKYKELPKEQRTLNDYDLT